jgi:hypothetical protein
MTSAEDRGLKKGTRRRRQRIPFRKALHQFALQYTVCSFNLLPKAAAQLEKTISSCVGRAELCETNPISAMQTCPFVDQAADRNTKNGGTAANSAEFGLLVLCSGLFYPVGMSHRPAVPSQNHGDLHPRFMVDPTDRTSDVTSKGLLVRTFIFLGLLALLFYIFSDTEVWPAAQVYVGLLALMGLGAGLILLRSDRCWRALRTSQRA